MVRASELELGKFFWAFWCLNSPSLIYSVACKNGNPWKGGLLTRTSMLYKMRDSFAVVFAEVIKHSRQTWNQLKTMLFVLHMNSSWIKSSPGRQIVLPLVELCLCVCFSKVLKILVCASSYAVYTEESELGNKLITFCRPFLDVYAVWIMSYRFFRSTPWSMLRKFHSERARR